MTVQWEAIHAGQIDHERLWGPVGLACLALGGLWARQVGLIPIGCLFKAVTGVPCLTCGASRAAVALAHGHAMEAFRLHPLVAAGAAAGAFYVPWALVTAACPRRLRVHWSAREWRGLRILAWTILAATWVWLIADGR